MMPVDKICSVCRNIQNAYAKHAYNKVVLIVLFYCLEEGSLVCLDQ
jgi:hypothetical protein